jgi:hypothetical protein
VRGLRADARGSRASDDHRIDEAGLSPTIVSRVEAFDPIEGLASDAVPAVGRTNAMR